MFKKSLAKVGATGAALGVLRGVGAVTPVTAAPGDPVRVTVHTDFSAAASEFEGDIPGCPTGTVVEAAGGPHDTPWGGVYAGTKVFTCDSGAGGFDVRVTARFGDFGSTGRWAIVDAWGAYDGVTGSGSLVGSPTEAGIDDVYTGVAR